MNLRSWIILGALCVFLLAAAVFCGFAAINVAASPGAVTP